MTDFTARVQQSVGRHFVTLSCVHQPPGASDVRAHVLSGFIVEIAGEWFYLTAGHILRAIRAALAAGSTFGVWRLGDQTAGNRFENKAVPYDFQLEHWCVLEDASIGLDYAAVRLGGLYRQQLEAGGVMAFGQQAWADHVVEHDHWALVGVPSESVSYDGVSTISARVVLAPLVPTEAPVQSEGRAASQFYAKLADGSEGFVKDIDGMSGGPIIMLRQLPGDPVGFSPLPSRDQIPLSSSS